MTNSSIPDIMLFRFVRNSFISQFGKKAWDSFLSYLPYTETDKNLDFIRFYILGRIEDLISSTFSWDNTKEGEGYWRGVDRDWRLWCRDNKMKCNDLKELRWDWEISWR